MLQDQDYFLDGILKENNNIKNQGIKTLIFYLITSYSIEAALLKSSVIIVSAVLNLPFLITLLTYPSTIKFIFLLLYLTFIQYSFNSQSLLVLFVTVIYKYDIPSSYINEELLY